MCTTAGNVTKEYEELDHRDRQTLKNKIKLGMTFFMVSFSPLLICENSAIGMSSPGRPAYLPCGRLSADDDDETICQH